MPFTPHPHFNAHRAAAGGDRIQQRCFPVKNGFAVPRRLLYNGRGGGVRRSSLATNTCWLSGIYYVRPCSVWARSVGWMEKRGGGAEEWSLQVHAALCAVPLFQLSTSFASAHTLNPSVSPFFFTLVLLLLFVRLAEVWNILRGSTGNVAAVRIKGEDTQTLMSRSDKRGLQSTFPSSRLGREREVCLAQPCRCWPSAGGRLRPLSPPCC